MVLAGFELPTSAGGKDCELNIFPITRVRDAMRDHLCNGDVTTMIAAHCTVRNLNELGITGQHDGFPSQPSMKMRLPQLKVV